MSMVFPTLMKMHGLKGWTTVVGRKEKCCHLPEVFLWRFPPEARLCHANQSDPSDSSGSDQDLDNLIPSYVVVTFSFEVIPIKLVL